MSYDLSPTCSLRCSGKKISSIKLKLANSSSCSLFVDATTFTLTFGKGDPTCPLNEKKIAVIIDKNYLKLRGKSDKNHCEQFKIKHQN